MTTHQTKRWQISSNRRLLLFVSVIIVILLFWHFRANTKTIQHPNSVLTVTVQTVENKEMSSTLELFGKTTAEDLVPVYADMMQGRITQVLVAEGDHVKAGQQLAVVDTALAKVQRVQSIATKQRAIVAFSEAEAALEDAKKQLEQAHAERLRGEKVAQDGLISKEVVEQRTLAEQTAESKVNSARNQVRMALSDVLSANAQVDEADLKIKQAELIAPVTGRVVERNAVIGQLLSQTSQPQFLLVKDDKIEVDIQISPEELPLVKNHMPVLIKVDGLSGTHHGYIRKKGAMVKDENQMVHLKAAFSSANEVIPGQSAKIYIKLPHRSGLFVPDTSVTSEGNNYFVYAVEQQRAKRIPVTVGERLDGQIEIIDGLLPGMQIIDKFAGFVRDGEPVHVVQAEH